MSRRDRIERIVVRLWLDDRPGALGGVASRIGALKGDVVGIDILERGGGRAVDELLVEVPADLSLDLLVREIGEVDGVDVEQVRVAAGALGDPKLDALEMAASLVQVDEISELFESLVDAVRAGVDGVWAALVDLEQGELVEAMGVVPEAAWLVAFVEGAASSDAVVAGGGPMNDIAFATLTAAQSALLIGRDGVSFRARERRQVSLLASIADLRYRELQARAVRRRHPSVTRK